VANGLNIKVKIDAARGTAEFREARREINARTKAGLRIAGEREALPVVRVLAPMRTGRLRSSLVVRATTRNAFLTTNLRGKKGRYVGLQEFGGVVRTPIKPKKAKALHFGGRFAAKVTTPRKYRGHHFMELGIRRAQPRIQKAIVEEVTRAFDGINDD